MEAWLLGVLCPVFLCLSLPLDPLQACWVNTQKVGKPGQECGKPLYWGLGVVGQALGLGLHGEP